MKRRDDITIYEYAEVLKKRGYDLHPLMKDLLGEPLTTAASFDWPASFYEEPPAKSFGLFTDSILKDRWGHCLKKKHGGFYCVEAGEGSVPYDTFTPCMPTDVDADGMPLEAE